VTDEQQAERKAISGQKPLFDAMTEGCVYLFPPINLEEIDLIVDKVEPEIEEEFSEIDPEARTAYGLLKDHGALKALSLASLYESRMRHLHEHARRVVRPAPISETVAHEPITFRSFISDEESARLAQRKSRPSIGLDLPENDPLRPPKRTQGSLSLRGNHAAALN
jgi:hypothetical protein